MQLTSNYNPDVLTCLANLSNDEVFTPPSVVNQMLDMLPAELFRSSRTTFLDPVSKSGVFLREIAKRLMIGLEAEIPDVRERANHIFTRQLFGISITELTSLISRRSVYCSKAANGRYSLCTAFDDAQGNIRFRPMEHTFVGGKCKYCGAAENVFGKKVRGNLESHAYEFIHNLKNFKDMKFDVIIGNPPYQLSDGSGNGAGAIPIYNQFVEQAKKLNPRFLTMIIPARWYSGGRNLDKFRNEMLHDDRIRILHDFPISTDCFQGVQIEGGVCYFLWDRDNKGLCRIISHLANNTIQEDVRPLLEEGCETFIRNKVQVNILHKVRKDKDTSFSTIVSANDPFGYDVRVANSYKRIKPTFELKNFPGASLFYYYGWQKEGIGYIDRNTSRKGSELIDKWKVMITQAYGMGNNFPTQVLNKPFVAPPNSLCSETYITIGAFEDKETAENVCSYISTNFFRFMVLFKKNTQHATKAVYQFVPLQDFSHPWTDALLYEKYGLSEDEIAFIESMIRPME